MKNNVIVRRSPGPMECVRMFFSRATDFKGRSRRMEYGIGVLVVYVGWLVLCALATTFFEFTYGVDADPSEIAKADADGILAISGMMLGSWVLWLLITFLPVTAISVRRLHDIGWSGKLYIFFLIGFCIPFANFGVAIMWWIIALRDSSPEVNEWGESPKYPAPDTPA